MSAYGRHHCFRALSALGGYVYQAYYVPDSGQLINVTQTTDADDRLLLVAAYHRNIPRWQHAGPLDGAADCAAAAFDAGGGEAGAVATIDPTERPAEVVYYCFRAEVAPEDWILQALPAARDGRFGRYLSGGCRSRP